jgi:hypothetical protein
MKHAKPSLRTLFIMVLSTLLALSACIPSTAVTPDREPIENNTQVDSGDGVARECEIEGTPCSYADMDPDTLVRSAEALDQAAAVLDETASMEAAAEVLGSRGDLAELVFGLEAISFRLEEGPEMWLVNGAALTQGEKGPGAGRAGASTVSIDFSALSPEFLQDDGPIGESRSGEEPFKKALILSPFWWDFGGDETQELATLIRQAHRNYSCDDCQVHWKHNTIRDRGEDESPEEYLLTRTLSLNQEVSLTDYASWEEYDLVHLSSHGMQICSDGNCKGVIMTGRFVTKPEWTQAGTPDFDVPGVLWGRTAVPGCGALDKKLETGNLPDQEWDEVYEQWLNKGCATYTNRWWQFINSDFFEAAYDGHSLDDKMIFINSCQSMKDLTLAKSIAGDNTTVLGWTEVVEVEAAGQVSLAFYNLYVTNGIRAQVAFKKVKRDLEPIFQSPALRGFRPKGIEIESLAPPEFLQEGDDDTRGREIVTLLQPIYRQELKERDAIPTLGVPGDGKPDEVLLLVQVDGIDEDQDPGNFEIHFMADGEELNKTIRPQEASGEYSYLALGLLELPFDATKSRYIELESWVELPEGGQSRHVLEEVELANCGWRATLSGARSGEIAGDITVPTSTISSATIEQLSQLEAGGLLGPGQAASTGFPSASELATMPESFMLGNREQFPFMFIIPDQSAFAMFTGNTFAAGEQASVSKSEESVNRKQGTFSATLIDLMNQQPFSAQGEYTWHQDSLCSMDVILELAANPFPESMIPPGIRP